MLQASLSIDSRQHIVRTGLSISLLIALVLLVTAPNSVAQYQVKTPQSQASITVTNPSGNADWEKGKRYEVTWTSSGIRGSVKIDLINQAGSATSLVRMTRNSGKYAFTLMRNIGDGDYKIRISTTDGKTVGEGSGTVSISSGTPSRPSAGGTQTSTPTRTYQPKTSTPLTPSKEPLQPAGSEEQSGLTESSPSGASAGELSEVETVRRELTAVQATDAHIEYIEAMSAEELRAMSASLPTTLGGVLAVTEPSEEEEWVAGERHPIEWASADLDGDVKIDLVRFPYGGAPKEVYPLVAGTENDGVFDCLVPPNLGCKWWNFMARVASVDDDAEAYSAKLKVYTEPVDMTCKIIDMKRKWDEDYRFLWSETDKWLEFNVCLRNNGTQASVSVQTVSVVIVKEPEELVIYQEEWGFGNIYPRLWYTTPEPRKFDIGSSRSDLLFRRTQKEEVDMETGAYRVEVTVDPRNQLGENPALRDDNKWVVRFEIK